MNNRMNNHMTAGMKRLPLQLPRATPLALAGRHGGLRLRFLSSMRIHRSSRLHSSSRMHSSSRIHGSRSPRTAVIICGLFSRRRGPPDTGTASETTFNIALRPASRDRCGYPVRCIPFQIPSTNRITMHNLSLNGSPLLHRLHLKLLVNCQQIQVRLFYPL